eukprot:CAMPEP_0119342436 /NCGR_PEP_ID=MMETSP1333-20130426/104706_1 /TAXON_ID=418940 /ORGANISM="Scyphosphaera apsteinii, Strain RCC1455" /LENGTH=154 /DNA_ID=CAMNT_0007354653 /DNA_START=62 /DNA_END=522 /DNA_ORIENTATION=-
MEAMVPELEDLKRRGWCSHDEVKMLAKRRERCEYLLHRPQPIREDFLHCLQLEMNLAALLRCRRKRLGLPKQSAAQIAVRRRIHFVFCRAVRRFKGDERMWLEWITYAERTCALNRLGKIYGRALALLPNSVLLWTKAAAFELEMRSNATGARR